jgi:hypothetical protein
MAAAAAIYDLASQLTALRQRMGLSPPSDNFPIEKLESLQHAKRRFAALVAESTQTRKSLLRMLELFMAYPKKADQVMTEIRTLENLEFQINIVQGFLDSKLTEETFSKEICILVSELYNKFNYAVCAASGPEAIHIKVSVARMAEATKSMPEHQQRFCWGDDILDDMMSEHGCSMSDCDLSDGDW